MLTIFANTYSKNKELSSARGFGLLKVCWPCLLKRLDNDIENVASIIISCFILHNILQINGDNYEDVDGLVAAIIREERIERAWRALRMGVVFGNMRDILADFVSNQIYYLYLCVSTEHTNEESTYS